MPIENYRQETSVEDRRATWVDKVGVIELSIFASIKQDYRVLRDGQPGRRFRSYVDVRRKWRGGKRGVGRIARDLLAIALIVIGIAIGWLSGPGGILAIIGLALIAQEVPWIAGVLDATEVGVRRILRSCKGLFIFRSE